MGKFKIPSWIPTPSFGPPPAPDSKRHSRPSPLEDAHRLASRRDAPTPSSTMSASDADDSQPDAHAPPGRPDGDDVSRLVALARSISAEADRLEGYLRESNSPMPGFAVDAPADFPSLPDDVQRSRQQIVYDTLELGRLVRGPRESVRWGAWSFLDTLSLHIIYSYGIAKLVPLTHPITLSELQTKTPLDSTNLARTLRHAMTNSIFYEPSPGSIAHTAASRLLAEDQALQDWVGFQSEDIFPAAANVVNALRAHPEATSLTTTGFNYAFDTVDKEPMFVTFGKDPDRARRMGGAMTSLTGGEGYELSHFVDNYDLSDVDGRGGTFVDIGGSHGFMSVALARKWKGVHFVVQDLPKTVESAPKPVCDDSSIADRVRLEAHDFFQEQPVKDADVYFFRWIIHNYSTPYAVNLLKNLVPALKPGARIVINDHCLREPGSENPWDERIMRCMDMVMLTLLNAQERHEREFQDLFAAADEGFVFKGVARYPSCRMSVVEAVWDPKPREAE